MNIPTLTPNETYIAGTVVVEVIGHNTAFRRKNDSVTLKFTVTNINGHRVVNMKTMKVGEKMTVPFPMEWVAP